MKIRNDEKGVLYVQIKPRDKYYLLLHRLNKGKYEQYIQLNNEKYILSLDELKQVRKYITKMEVKKYGDRSTKKSIGKISEKPSRKDKRIAKTIPRKKQGKVIRNTQEKM